MVGVDVPMLSIDGPQDKDDLRRAPHVLATAPTSPRDAGISLSPTAAAEEPVATF